MVRPAAHGEVSMLIGMRDKAVPSALASPRRTIGYLINDDYTELDTRGRVALASSLWVSWTIAVCVLYCLAPLGFMGASHHFLYLRYRRGGNLAHAALRHDFRCVWFGSYAKQSNILRYLVCVGCPGQTCLRAILDLEGRTCREDKSRIADRGNYLPDMRHWKGTPAAPGRAD